MATEVKKVIIFQPGEAKTVSLGPNRVNFLISGEQTGGKYSLTEFVAAPPPAPAAPIHIHQVEDETCYVLEGQFQFIIREQSVVTTAGSVVFVPRGTPHTVINSGPGLGRLLVYLSPPGFEQYWKEMAHLLSVYDGQPAPELVIALQEKYHMDTGGQARQFIND
jgi:quercetin dioxygenase-like cupin family protein